MSKLSITQVSDFILCVILVTFTCMAVDALFFFVIWPGANSYGDSFWEKLAITSIFSLFYVPIYLRAAKDWLPFSQSKVFNGIAFNLVLCMVIILAMTLMETMVTVVYVYLLHGFRGELPTAEVKDAVILTTEVVLAGVVLDLTGKTEDNPRQS